MLRAIAEAVKPTESDFDPSSADKRKLCSFVRAQTQTWKSWLESLKWWNPAKWTGAAWLARKGIDAHDYVARLFVSNPHAFLVDTIRRLQSVQSSKYLYPIVRDLGIFFDDYERQLMVEGTNPKRIQSQLSHAARELLKVLKAIAVFEQGYMHRSGDIIPKDYQVIALELRNSTENLLDAVLRLRDDACEMQEYGDLVSECRGADKRRSARDRKASLAPFKKIG